MDFGSAAVLSAVVLGLVALAKSIIFGSTNERLVAVVCLVIGIAATLLVGASDFAAEQIVLDKPLEDMNVWSQLLVGVLAGGLASAGWQGIQAIKSIGENPGSPEVP